MKIGIMLMSTNGPDGKPTDWRKYLANCKDHGLEAVDVFDRMLQATGETVADMKTALADLGLEPSIYCVPTDLVSPDPKARQESLDTVKRGVDACLQLGIDQLFSHGGQHNNQGEEALNRYIDGLQQAADIAAEQDITFSIENAGKLCNTDTELKRCIDAVARGNMKITYDGGNFLIAGCDAVQAAAMLGPQVSHTHIKSLNLLPAGEAPPYRYCPIDEGPIDYRAVRDTLISAGFDGCMSFEPSGGLDCQLEHSMDVLTQIVNEVR